MIESKACGQHPKWSSAIKLKKKKYIQIKTY